jgi:hypothetical protein
MTDDKPTPSELLARARRAWSPRATDAERVRRAIGAALLGDTTTGAAHAGPPAPAWASRLLVAGVIAAASGGAGYWAGYRAGLRGTPTPAPVVAWPRPEVAIAEPKSPAAPSPETPPLALPSLVASRHDAHGTRHGLESRTPAQTDSLAIEVRALRNAERALRDGNPGLALAFLRELDRQVPNGQLAEERDAADTLARCARGDHPFGVNLAAEFTERHPGSVYRARVEEACAATDSPPPGDSPPGRSE